MSSVAEEEPPSNEETAKEANSLIISLKAKLAEVESGYARLTDLVAAADAKVAEINAIATAALATKTQITDEQAVIATKSAHIQSAQEHADKVRAELDRIQTAALQQATEAEGQRQRAQTSSDAAAQILTVINAHKTAAESDAAAAAKSLDMAKVSAAASKALGDKAKEVEENITAYEQHLAGLDAEAKAQLETITSLLPGATSAGLAYAFNDRRKTFLKPAILWQALFVIFVLAIVVLTFTGLWQVFKSGGTPLSWSELARLWLARLPVVGALVWLALYASRESALAKRLEEDYGYKAAIAASFQGFQEQMAAIGGSTPEGSPLSKLCGDTLATIGSPPGRIYEKHGLTVSPTGELTAATQAVASDKLKK